MLKIQRWVDADGSVGFSLSGRIRASHVSDLEALIAAEDAPPILDLKEVTLVAQEVVRFLGQAEADGVTLRDCPGYIRVWIAQQRSE